MEASHEVQCILSSENGSIEIRPLVDLLHSRTSLSQKFESKVSCGSSDKARVDGQHPMRILIFPLFSNQG